jgi:hypothetical protein
MCSLGPIGPDAELPDRLALASAYSVKLIKKSSHLHACNQSGGRVKPQQ